MSLHIDPGVMSAGAEIAIALVNPEYMIANAIDQAFAPLGLTHMVKGKTVPFVVTLEHWALLSTVVSQTYSWSGLATTSMTYTAGALWLDTATGAATRILREMEGILVVQRQNDADARSSHWRIKDSSIMKAIAEVAVMKQTIAQVVALQMANPDDAEIGSDRLPPGIYFNIVADFKKRQADLEAELRKAEAVVMKVAASEAANNLDSKE